MRHLMSPLDLSIPELEKLLDLASDVEKNPKKYAHTCDDKRLTTLFYGPSTHPVSVLKLLEVNLGSRFLVSHLNSSFAAKRRGNCCRYHSYLFPAMRRYLCLCVIPKRCSAGSFYGF